MPSAWQIFKAGPARAVGLLAVLLLLVAIGINFYDPPPSAVAQSLLAPSGPPVPDDDNLFLALMGAQAPAGSDVIADGRARIDAYNARVASLRKASVAAPAIEPGAGARDRLKFEGKLALCERPDADCWRDARQRQPELDALLGANRILVDRVRGLQHLGHYQDLATPDFLADIANVYFGKDEHQLLLADLARRLQAGPLAARQQALAELLADIGVWRRVLGGDGTLLSTMVGFAYTQRAEATLALCIGDPQCPIEQLAPDGLSLPPLWNPDDSPMSRAFASEFRGQAAMWERLRSGRAARVEAPGLPEVGWWSRQRERMSMHFLQPNATANLQALVMQQWMQAAAAPPREVQAALARSDSWRVEHAGPPRWYTLYNPMGRLLIGIAAPDYSVYVLRAWDFVAYQRLLLLHAAIRRERISPGQVPAFMAAHPEWSTHPVDGRPFLWDAQAGTLAVQVLGKHPAGRPLAVKIWRDRP